MGVGELTIHCHHQHDFGIKTGSDESHFNFSFIEYSSWRRTVVVVTVFIAVGQYSAPPPPPPPPPRHGISSSESTSGNN